MWIVHGTSHSEAGSGRHRNQDACFVDDELGLYAVADGFGGHPAGEIASGAAIATLQRTVRHAGDELQRLRESADTLATTHLLEHAILEACSEVHAMGKTRPEWGGMCTSLTAVLIIGERAVVAHVGNSRLYLARGGDIHQLTAEHTLAAELARSGAVSTTGVHEHPLSHVLTRAIGSHEAVLVDTMIVELLRDDRMILTTRGGAEYFDLRPQQGRELLEDLPLDELPERLVNAAREFGTGGDLTIVTIGGAPGQEVTETSDTRRRLNAVGSPFLFEGMSLPELTHVLNVCTMTTYLPGEIVVAKGDPLDGLLMGLDGRFELVRRDEVLETFTGGNHAGATALLIPRAARATLRAVTPGRILTLTPEGFRALAQQRPHLGSRLMERLATRLSHELEEARASGAGQQHGPGLL